MEMLSSTIVNIIEYLPHCNTFVGIMFYSFVTYFIFLLLLRLTYRTDKEYEELYEQEMKKTNQKIQDRREVKSREAKELLEKVTKYN
jgi:hypothetical protein